MTIRKYSLSSRKFPSSKFPINHIKIVRKRKYKHMMYRDMALENYEDENSMELITQENIIQIPSPEVTENENPLSNIIMAPEDQSQPIAGTSNRIEDNHSDISDNKSNHIKTISKVYADVLAAKPSTFYEYETYTPVYDDIEDYALFKKLGSGKYSIVFEGFHHGRGERVVIKMLKPVKRKKIKREIKILEGLKGGPNIVKLLAVVEIPSALTALIFEEMVNNEDFKNVYLKLSEEDTQYYLYQLLRALDYCHSSGIMHRDVKPHNLIIDRENRQIRLIDWGLAEFYHPGQEYNVRVASRYFKGPELLVDYNYYDYSLDMWSFGCVFASMLFRREPFFHGSDNQDQLVRIVKVLGTSELNLYLKKYNITLDDPYIQLLGHHSRKSWQRFINTESEYLVDSDAFNLLESCLKIDHMERITAKQALAHQYFAKVRRRPSIETPRSTSTLTQIKTP